MSLYAVITGDVVNSTCFERERLLQDLHEAFFAAQNFLGKHIHGQFEIYRGDGFQGIITEPKLALKAALILRLRFKSLEANIRYKIDHKIKTIMRLDMRIAIGIGSIAYLPEHRPVGEAEGEAFHYSGRTLDQMKSERLLIMTPWQKAQSELDTECYLLDALVNKWTNKMNRIMELYLTGLNQIEIAKILDTKQPNISRSLRLAGATAVTKFCNRFEEIINENIIN